MSATTVAEYEAAMQRPSDPLDQAVGYLLLVCVVVLSIKGNQWAVENLLKKGWRFEDVSDPVVKSAVKKWKISKHYLKSMSSKDEL